MGRVPGAPCIGRPCGMLGGAARGGGAVYTGRGPVCGVIILLCCPIGWPGTGLVDGATGVPCGPAAVTGGVAGVFGCATGGVTTTAGGCAGGITTTAGGAAGFSTGGGATTAGAAGLTTGDVTTTLLSAAGAAGLGITTAGFSADCGAAAGVAVFTGVGGAAGVAAGALAGGAGGFCCCCSLSLSSLATSPGLEILERSIFGFTSVADVLSREDEPDLAKKCFRTRTASSSSIELEWVFFSVTPTSGRISRITLAFTSSSLARSLIRIFIRSLFPPSTCYAIIMTSRFCLESHYEGSSDSSSGFATSGSTRPASAGCSSPWVCTSATSASGAFSTPAITAASLAWPVSTASAYSVAGSSVAAISATGSAASAPSTAA